MPKKNGGSRPLAHTTVVLQRRVHMLAPTLRHSGPGCHMHCRVVYFSNSVIDLRDSWCLCHMCSSFDVSQIAERLSSDYPIPSGGGGGPSVGSFLTLGAIRFSDSNTPRLHLNHRGLQKKSCWVGPHFFPNNTVQLLFIADIVGRWRHARVVVHNSCRTDSFSA
jgi:hypothetical protein